jgi:hypothetical protein
VTRALFTFRGAAALRVDRHPRNHQHSPWTPGSVAGPDLLIDLTTTAVLRVLRGESQSKLALPGRQVKPRYAAAVIDKPPS